MASRVVGVIGLVLYNWWLGALVHGGIVSSPDALFSDLEASGGRYAVVFSRLDIAAGVVLLVALALRGRWGVTGLRPEWWLLLVFAAAGAVGGFFPYSCPEGVNAVCRTAEWEFQLPWRQYVHVAAGIVEFAAATLAIVLARRRTAGVPIRSEDCTEPGRSTTNSGPATTGAGSAGIRPDAADPLQPPNAASTWSRTFAGETSPTIVREAALGLTRSLCSLCSCAGVAVATAPTSGRSIAYGWLPHIRWLSASLAMTRPANGRW